MQHSIIGAIIVATLAGCGSITLAPEDSAPVTTNGPDVVTASNADAASGLPDGENTSIRGDGGLLDVHQKEEVRPVMAETDADIDETSSMDVHEMESGTDSMPPAIQTCAPATCYRKSDPDHTTCPCHY